MKARIRTFFDNILFTPKPLQEASYQGNYLLPDKQTCRLHLRISPKGEGLLILNASTILHLNSSATEFAYHLIKGTPENVVVDELTKRYRTSSEQVASDLATFVGRLDSLILIPDLDPESFLDFDRIELHQDNLSAPLRLDCALTYQIPEGSTTVYTPADRVKRLLSTDEWKTILQKSWDKGIPHVIFTGGEPTLRTDLSELISFSEKLGQVTGLITDGLRFSEKGYLDSLLQSGLDHLLFVLDPVNSDSFKALKTISDADISFAVHLTINNAFLSSSDSFILKIKELGTTKVSLSANSPETYSNLEGITRKIHEAGLSLVWDMPVPYSEMNPIVLELQNSENMIKGAARAWLYVEPDGDVLPGQGIDTVIGNFLSDQFDSIWSAAKLWLNEPK